MIKYTDTEIYPYSTRCYCGNRAHLYYKKIVIKEKEREVIIGGVPVYECVLQHDNLARRTRVKINKILEKEESNGSGYANKLYSKLTIE